jgi:hypothetical protein
MYFYGALGHALALLLVLFIPLYEVRRAERAADVA